MVDYFTAHANEVIAYMVSLGPACPQLAWNTRQYRCVPSGVTRSSANTPGGFALGEDGSVAMVVADFAGGPTPRSEQFVTYPAGTNADYRIEAVTVEAGGRVLRLKLTSRGRL